MKNLIVSLAFILFSTTSFAGAFHGKAKVDIFDGSGNYRISEAVEYTGDSFRKGHILAALDFKVFGPSLLALRGGNGSLIYKGVKHKVRYAAKKGKIFMGIYKKYVTRTNTLSDASLSDSSVDTSLSTAAETQIIGGIKYKLVAVLVFHRFNKADQPDPTTFSDQTVKDLSDIETK
jgi:hypothetical protein